MPNDAALRARPQPTTADEPVVSFTSLPREERAVVRPALDGRVVRACPSDADRDALQSFANSVEQGTHLRHEGTDFGLWLRIADAVYVGTTDPPESDDDPCGLL